MLLLRRGGELLKYPSGRAGWQEPACWSIETWKSQKCLKTGGLRPALLMDELLQIKKVLRCVAR